MSMILHNNILTSAHYAVLTVFMLLVGVSAANATTVNGNASAEIRELIQVTEDQSINFGILLIEAGIAGTASISTTGSISTINSTSQSGGIIQSGSFSASGSPNSALNISFQNGVLTGAGGSMALTTLNHDAGATPTFDGSGVLNFAVGGTLEINTDQPTGSYSGTYQITLDYQ